MQSFIKMTCGPIRGRYTLNPSIREFQVERTVKSIGRFFVSHYEFPMSVRFAYFKRRARATYEENTYWLERIEKVFSNDVLVDLILSSYLDRE